MYKFLTLKGVLATAFFSSDFISLFLMMQNMRKAKQQSRHSEVKF